MSVRNHPTKEGWQQIVISRGRNKKQLVIAYKGTRTEALAAEREMKDIPPDGAIKVADLLPRYLEWYKINRAEGSYDDLNVSMKHLIPHFGSTPVLALTPSLYESYKAARREKVKKRTINKELSYLTGMLKKAVKDMVIEQPRHWPEPFPKKSTKPPIPKILTRQQIDALIEKLSDPVKGLIICMVWGGLRKEVEAFNLQVKDVWLDRGVMHITGKGEKERIVIIIGPMKEALQEAIEGKKPNDYVFPNPKTGKPYTNIRRRLVTAAKAAGIQQHVYPHLLRHCFGTMMMASGAHPKAVQMMMGHEEQSTTDMYIHLSADFLIAEATKATSERSDSKISRKPRPGRARRR